MLSYIVPLRRWQIEPVDELATYLDSLADAPDRDVIVVDGSDPEIFDHHRQTFSARVRHLPVDPHRCGRSGKVNGVLTGVDAALNDRLILADDDVRYDESTLLQVVDLLEQADLVRPQNYFDPLPWHARWDTARSLLNRCFAADFPGTLAVRRSALQRVGGYDSDVLFENLELMRTLEAAGGISFDASHVYVRRIPPTTRQFVRQRVRQAYDSAATPVRMLLELSLLPLIAVALRRRSWRGFLVGATAAIAAAERGRRRHGGQRVFAPSTSMFAPLWLAERAVCAWLAIWLRFFKGGVGYAGTRFRRTATSRRELRRRLHQVNSDSRPCEHEHGRAESDGPDDGSSHSAH